MIMAPPKKNYIVNAKHYFLCKYNAKSDTASFETCLVQISQVHKKWWLIISYHHLSSIMWLPEDNCADNEHNEHLPS